ncbi:hypothetical protein QE430_003512 [Microbacterium testaceum]|nr:hypothetical protein [Microbacterium testaceum]
MTEDEVLVVLDAALTVEVDVEELAVVQRLGDAGGEVQTRHLLVADLGVQAHELGALERVDERDRVAERRQQDVAARLVGLGLDGEADVVALVGDVVAEQVDGLAVALERLADVLRGIVLGALAAAPHDEGLGAELGGEVEVAQHLAQRETTHLTVVRGEAAVLEHGGREEVGGHHRRDDAGVVHRALEAVDLLLTLGVGGAEGEEVVVVEGQAVGAELGELLDGVDDVEGLTRGAAEGVGAVVADGPETERELVVAGGGGHSCSFAWTHERAVARSGFVGAHNIYPGCRGVHPL